MNFRKALHLLAVSGWIAIAVPGVMLAQGVDAQMLLHPPATSWPGYHGDYSGRRHSSLTQITPTNVKNLGLAWAFQIGASMLKVFCIRLPPVGRDITATIPEDATVRSRKSRRRT